MLSPPRTGRQTGTLALLLALSATVSGGLTANLFARDSGTCPANSDYCQGNFPPNFCCPSGNSCISLAANTTVLCCPSGSKCVTIYPLSCDITQQNPSANPDAPVKTMALTGKMEQCGDGTCCPFGYGCNGSGKCQRAADQNTPPPGYTPPSASASSSTTASAAPTTSASNSTVPNSSASPSTSSPPEASESGSSPGGPSVGVIAGAVIGTIGGGVMLALVALYCIRRKANLGREKKEADKRSSSFGNIISAPLASPPGSVMRNDFMRKPVAGGSGSFEFDKDSLPRHASPPRSVQAESRYGPEKARYTIPNPFNDAESRWSGEPGLGDDALVSPSSTTFSGRRLTPTPPPPPPNRGRAREPSAFSINVFATEDTLSNPGTPPPPPPLPTDNRYTHMTTFTSMMEAAGMSGVGDEMPYVPEDAYRPRTDVERSPERRI